MPPREDQGSIVTSKEDYDKSIFDHSFSGMSVWIEPEITKEFEEKMDFLQQSCGAELSGVSPFVPHITLLYNVSMDQFENPQECLTDCWEQFQSRHVSTSEEDTSSITASDWFYFHYPKEADDGRGFGCSICLLLIKLSPWLEALQRVCKESFGPGERSNNFIPHISLVYAPENKEEFLQSFTDDQQQMGSFLNQPIRIKYLSLWSTQGRMNEWYRIARIPVS